jgi:histidyl-tRNA synthetase
MRLADKLGATHVLIVGEEELAAGALTVRDMIAQRDHARAVSFPCTAAELRGTLERLSASEVGRNQ